MNALGLIETCGLVPAIAGADAMVKAADVRIESREQVGAGLVTVTVRGEVAAVRAAVDAGVAEIRRMGGCLVAEHVIARPDSELCVITGGGTQAAQAAQTVVEEDGSRNEERPQVEPAYEISQLQAMTAAGLRRLASGLPGMPLTPEQIGTARKKTLIEAIITAYRQE
jgi:microcompartment protein CcmL/EutN